MLIWLGCNFYNHGCEHLLLGGPPNFQEVVWPKHVYLVSLWDLWWLRCRKTVKHGRDTWLLHGSTKSPLSLSCNAEGNDFQGNSVKSWSFSWLLSWMWTKLQMCREPSSKAFDHLINKIKSWYRWKHSYGLCGKGAPYQWLHDSDGNIFPGWQWQQRQFQAAVNIGQTSLPFAMADRGRVERQARHVGPFHPELWVFLATWQVNMFPPRFYVLSGGNSSFWNWTVNR